MNMAAWLRSLRTRLPLLRPTLHRLLRLSVFLTPLLLVAALLLLTMTCSYSGHQLEQVRTLGVLRVATLNSPTTYYEGPFGPTGFEYELVSGFAERLGVEVELVVVGSAPEALRELRRGRVHLAAAGIAISPDRLRHFRFTPELMQVQSELVYRMGRPRPRSLATLPAGLVVGAGTAHEELLRSARAEFPDLTWKTRADSETETLLYQVSEGQVDYTVAHSNLIQIHQRYFHQLRTAFAIGEPQSIAWALARSSDRSLSDAATAYIESLGEEQLAGVRERHFGHIQSLDYVSSVTLAQHVDTRLPRYRRHFEEAGATHGIDWRLLAAMGYQESHWNPKAVSPTGVRGIMMLTLQTARALNVEDREDPRQSIEGGARYFRGLLDRFAEIPEPDRYWVALAAYNLGPGHVHDLRRITTSQEGDPNRWTDLRDRLPLLTQRQWYSQTKHGYARGFEALHYVASVRTYYDMLIWMTEGRVVRSDDDTRNGRSRPEPTLPPPPTPVPLDPLSLHPPLL